MSIFIAILEPNPKCKDCRGTGKIRYYTKKRGQEARKISICGCCFIQYENDNFEEVLKKMAELAGRKVSRKSGVILANETKLFKP